MPTRNVVLTERHDALIRSLVAEGRYQNASEVLREGLRLIEAREAEHQRKLAAFNAAIQEGVDAYERGDYLEFDSFEDMNAYLERVSDAMLHNNDTRSGDSKG